MYRKGSITVYLSLMLLILLSLFTAALYSGQSAGVRMQAVHAADQGMYSLFSRYCIPMLERYHLFFIDGTFGGETLRMGRVYEILEDDTAMVLKNVNGISQRNGLIDGLNLENGSVIGYTLATDYGGNAVKSQAISYMEAVLGIQGVRSLTEKTDQQEEIVEELEHQQQITDEETIWELYENLDIAPSEENPIEKVKTAKGKGILNLIIADESNLSTAYYSVDKMVSGRNLNQGMGIPEYDSSCDSWQSELLFSEYIMRHFGCYTEQVPSDGLQYQLEYIIQGKSSDLENLKGVINRLIVIREVSNLQYLYSDAAKRAQVKTAATVLSTVCMAPEAAGVLEQVLLFCWAFGESILDVRSLCQGGSVPLIKDRDSWSLKLSNLAEIFQRDGDGQHSEEDGMTYQDYLRILLLMKGADEKLMRCMDMMELGMRASSGNAAFQLDACIYAMEVQFDFRTNRGLTYDAVRTYGYFMDE